MKKSPQTRCWTPKDRNELDSSCFHGQELLHVLLQEELMTTSITFKPDQLSTYETEKCGCLFSTFSHFKQQLIEDRWTLCAEVTLRKQTETFSFIISSGTNERVTLSSWLNLPVVRRTFPYGTLMFIKKCYHADLWRNEKYLLLQRRAFN